MVILPQEITFFDSFAKSAKHYVMNEYLHKMKRQMVVHKMVLQGPLSNVWGKFCTFFEYFVCRDGDLLIFLNILRKMLPLRRKLFLFRCRNFF